MLLAPRDRLPVLQALRRILGSMPSSPPSATVPAIDMRNQSANNSPDQALRDLHLRCYMKRAHLGVLRWLSGGGYPLAAGALASLLADGFFELLEVVVVVVSFAWFCDVTVPRYLKARSTEDADYVTPPTNSLDAR